MERGPTTRAKIHEESLFDFESLIMAQPVPQGVHPLVDGEWMGCWLGSIFWGVPCQKKLR